MVIIDIILLPQLLCLLIIQTVYGIPVDNGLIGSPEIECGTDAIYVLFNTQNFFEGHVYVKGFFETPSCRTDATNSYEAGIQVMFNTCGMRRERSVNPVGLYMSVTLVIMFHPQFLTKVDRAFEVRCFYMEAQKTLTAELEVSMLTTQVAEERVDMPNCRYEVLKNGPTGEKVRYAVVGEAVYHKWTCDSDTVDVFCMRVHSCYVDDGLGSRAQLLDSNGCALDRYLLQNLEYLTDLMAGQEAHVFKYADKPSLYFQCQISLYLKETLTCERPICYDPQAVAAAAASSAAASASASRQRRNVSIVPGSEFVMDVATDSLNVLDLEQGLVDSGDDLLGRELFQDSHRHICLSKTVLYSCATGILVLLMSTTMLAVFCLRRSRKTLSSRL